MSMFKRDFTPPSKSCCQSVHLPRSRRRGGLAIVEFALVVPILLTLLLGIMEFGWLVRNSLTLSNAAREGARVASLGRTTTDIRTRIQNSVGTLRVTSPNGDIIMRWSDNNGTDGYPFTITDTTATTSTPAVNTVPPGKLIRITVRTNNQALTGFFPFLRDRNVVSFATMRRE